MINNVPLLNNADDVIISEKSMNDGFQTLVYQLSTKVPYGNINSGFSFAVDTIQTSPAAQAIFVLTNNLLTLKDDAVIDYEIAQEYKIYFNCLTNPRESTTFEADSNFTLTVKILDDNDNNNIFNATFYSFTVDENVAIGTNIGQVNASDADITAANSATYYYIGANQFSNLFAINVTTGEITASGNLDYEVATSYALTVCATDNATDATQSNPLANIRNSCVPVTITLKDVNDNKPVFENYPYSIEVSEKVPVGRQVFTFSASDADSGLNAQIEYKALAMDTSLFSLNTTTGIVSVVAKLNYEVATSHNVTIYAEDKGKILSKYIRLDSVTCVLLYYYIEF